MIRAAVLILVLVTAALEAAPPAFDQGQMAENVKKFSEVYKLATQLMNLGGNVLNNVQGSSGSVRSSDGYGGDNEVFGEVVRPRFRGVSSYDSDPISYGSSSSSGPNFFEQLMGGGSSSRSARPSSSSSFALSEYGGGPLGAGSGATSQRTTALDKILSTFLGPSFGGSSDSSSSSMDFFNSGYDEYGSKNSKFGNNGEGSNIQAIMDVLRRSGAKQAQPEQESSKLSNNPLAARQRNVAQQRRRMETEEFQKLGAVLPISRAISEQHIDKTTIVRLASSYIKLHHLLGLDYGSYGNYDYCIGSLIDIIDGFLLVLSEQGDILYVSETISLHLGLSQVEMTGNLFWSYLHPHDALDFQRFLKSAFYSFAVDSSTFRIKSTLTKRSSRDLQNPNAGYKPIQITLTACEQTGRQSRYTVGYCQPHPGALGTNMKLNNETFIVTTDYSLSIIYIDPHIGILFEQKRLSSIQRSREFFGGNWVKGTSFYSLVAPEDVHLVQDLHQKLFKFTSVKSPLIKLISDDEISLFTVEIFGISHSSSIAHGNSQKSQNEHLIFVCTYVG
ncbi:hypothetical protein FO519_007275 [Halicephalobus sp. NKZ332]|nr:hypothetical protein FO519_007275 [Halicephalobus sp. NKZ332]